MTVETVSLCVIALNEASFLPNLLQNLLEQTYPHDKTEIVLVDSGSTDSTKAIMEKFAREHEKEYLSIQVADNPGRIQASGWNVAIKTATADVIIRIDAHTRIPGEFTERNMKNLQEGEYVSGGVRPCVIENNTPWGQMLLDAENSLFGSSVSISRRGTQKQYVKSLFHGAYRREVFEKVGLFNEELLRTEDNEMHYRIREAGYKICFDPEIVSYQYARSSLKKMIKQKYGNGYWIGLTLGVCPGCISLFHLVPFAFVLGILGTTLLACLGLPQLAILMWAMYACAVAVFTVTDMINTGFSVVKLLLPAIFLVLHVSYGVGTLVGLVKMPSWRKKIRPKEYAINKGE